jgi:hypothetical protein
MSDQKKELEGIFSDLEWMMDATEYPELIRMQDVALSNIHKLLAGHLPKLRAMYEEWAQYDDMRNS